MNAFWHSSAHILGAAIEQVYEDPLMTVGPATKDGFFYDFLAGDRRVVHESDYAAIEAKVKGIVKAKMRFEKLLLSKEQALDLFSYNRFKTELIEKKIPDNGLTSAYRIGDFVDLCTGPHISHTGLAKGFSVTKHSSAYWLGDAKRDPL